MRRFTYSDAKSHKFWEIEVTDNSFTATYGKIGTAGQSTTKTFADAKKAQAEADKLIKEKTGKGYREEGGSPAGGSAPSPGTVLEAAILGDPTNRAAHAAYADWLTEQGDPRGEFIQIQLALEDESLSPDQRKSLKTKETALLKAHTDEWVGGWQKFARNSGPEAGGQVATAESPFGFVRGILADATFHELSLRCALGFQKSEQTRLVRSLFVGDFAYEEDDEEDDSGLEPIDREALKLPEDDDDAESYPSQFILARWPHFKNLRKFQLGWTSDEEYDDYCPFTCHTSGDHAYDFVKQMPQLEEAYLFAHRVDAKKLFGMELPNLRVLQLYHSDDYPFAILAKNESMKNLTALLCHPHAMDDEHAYIRLAGLKAIVNSPNLQNLKHLRLRLTDFGDAGCKEIVKSGILKRLDILDIRSGCVTDAGAKILADSPDFKHLQRADLSRNALTKTGMDLLAATGVDVDTRYQHAPLEEDGDNEYLYQGDYE